DRRKRRSSRHSEQPLAGNQISAEQTPLYRASSDRMLLLKTEAVQARRNAIRKDRTKLLRRRNYRSSSALAKVNVHTIGPCTKTTPPACRNLDHLCKTTFAAVSAQSGHSRRVTELVMNFAGCWQA